MSGLTVTQLNVEIDGLTLVKDVSFSLHHGELTAILGSNGAGKSTLLRAIVGAQPFQSGAVTWNDQSLADLDTLSRAKTLSYLPQDRPISWPIQVHDVVALGRYAYGVSLGNIDAAEQSVINRAMFDCGVSNFAERSINTLSGGEQARVHCARTFAAAAPLLLADEPTTSLDPKHQIEIMKLLKSYAEQNCVLVILHDPTLAARFADRLIWLKDGEIIADGTPAETLTRETLATTYDIDASVISSGEHPYVEIRDTLSTKRSSS